MSPRSTAAFAAIGIYIISLVAVTFFAVIFLGEYSNAWVVPAEYLIPGLFAMVVFRNVRRQEIESRARRLKYVGRCVQCAYDLRASAGRCPECGHPIDLDSTTTRP